MSSMALQISQGSGTSPHRHTAAQIVLAMEDQLRVRILPAADWIECAAVLIPPNVTHHIMGSGTQALMIWFDPATPEARAMRMQSQNKLTLISEAEVTQHRTTFTKLSSHLQTCSDAQQLSTAITQAFLPKSKVVSPIDERIAVVLTTLRQPDWLNQPYPLTALASKVNLSTGRLRHLFRQELGVPLQQYWVGYRLLVAIQRLSAGVSLTELALDNGFADLAHFSRAFKASFGLSPSLALEDSRLIQVITCKD
jgi:AraC family transcriptional regulator